MDVPLTFLIDDILRPMAINQKNYFKLNKENAKDGMGHCMISILVKRILKHGLESTII